MSIPIFVSVISHEIQKLSTLSNEEFITLVGHYHKLCEGKPTDQLEGRGFTEAQLQAMRDHARTRFNPIESLGLRFTEPLDEFEFPSMDYILSLFHRYDKHGNLPFSGAVSDQPAKIIEIFNVLQSLRLESEAKARKKAELKTQRRSK